MTHSFLDMFKTSAQESTEQSMQLASCAINTFQNDLLDLADAINAVRSILVLEQFSWPQEAFNCVDFSRIADPEDGYRQYYLYSEAQSRGFVFQVFERAANVTIYTSVSDRDGLPMIGMMTNADTFTTLDTLSQSFALTGENGSSQSSLEKAAQFIKTHGEQYLGVSSFEWDAVSQYLTSSLKPSLQTC